MSLGPPLFCFLIVFSHEFVDVLELNRTEKLKNKKNTTDYIEFVFFPPFFPLSDSFFE